MRIGGVDFPEPLLNALREGRLVVFAGAGVSMGPPANLPGFRELALRVAHGTGLFIGEYEQEDRFLGRVKEAGPDVHQIAVQWLQQNNPQPTELHRNLLRLYSKNEDIRIVTTNFDLLFEEAANSLFDAGPKIFQAPALPLGQRFQGIVHIHGSVSEPAETVLTNLDFGRAYLTEADGWARRFLVDLFANHTVLFVGYSHNDTIMTYLTPALPRGDTGRRYALIGNQSDEPERWRNLGIEPIAFPQSNKNDYVGLDQSVEGLANHTRRGILDWQREISNIASAPPPIDEESAGIIEQALNDPVQIRFFLESAEFPEWIEWLDRRRHLDTLFEDRELSEQERMLASWLSRCFALDHDDALFRTIENHHSRLNPEFWKLLSWQMQDGIRKSPNTEAMTRWVQFLASVAPSNGDDIALSWIAEAAASIGAADSLLRIYEEMSTLINRVPPRLGQSSSDRYHYDLETMLTEHLNPYLPQIAESLLEISAMRLSERHSAGTAWGQSESTWDSDSISRSAIEPHSQDQFQNAVDALIDVARECLDWLATNRTEYARLWSERHSNSSVSLLRRLAIHTLTELIGLSADEKIGWLLERCDVNETAARHELFRAIASTYPYASTERRKDFADAVSAFVWPNEDEPDMERLEASHRYRWFQWLQQADLQCEIAKEAVDAVLARYPEFWPSDHPDFDFYWYGSEIVTAELSPWTVETLLAKPAIEMLPLLLEYQPTDRGIFDGYDRSAMLTTVREAARQNPDWGLDLADNLAASGQWEADLWPSILRAWAETEMAESSLQRVFSHLSAEELHKEHTRYVPDNLCELVQKVNITKDGWFLPKANAIAAALQQYADDTAIPNRTSYVGGVPQEVDWLTTAINHPSGKLAEFWLRSIELWRNSQGTAPQSISSEYLSSLNGIMQKTGVPGRLGRAILSSRLHFLLHVDEGWSLENLLPLFDLGHEDFRPAWDGFLTWGRITTQVKDSMREAFLHGVQRAKHEPDWRMQHRFLHRYTEMLVWSVSGPADEWITNLLSDSNKEVRRVFAERIGFLLRSLTEDQQKEWWNTWLKGYWENRLQGVPCPLDDEEITATLEWVIHLPGVFPEAASLAAQMRRVPLQRSMVLHGISESNLIDEEPDGLAKFLIHLGQCDTNPWLWHRTRETVDKLLTKELPPEIETGLHELIAKRGEWMGD